MHQKLLITAGLVLVLTIITTYFFTQKTQALDPRINQSILNGLDIGLIDQIIIQQEKNTVEMNKQPNGVWTLKQKHGFLVSLKGLAELLENLQTTKVATWVHKSPTDWENLNLQTPTAERTPEQGIQLSLFQQQEKVLDLLIGKPRRTESSTGGQYVRFLPGEKTYLLQDELLVATAPTDWLHTKAFYLEADEVQAFTMTDGRNSWHFERQTKEEPFAYGIQGLVPNQTQVNAYLQEFAPFSIQDLGSAKSNQPFRAERQVEFKLFDQTALLLQFRLNSGGAENDFYNLKSTIQNPVAERWQFLAAWNEDYWFKLSNWQGNYLWKEQGFFFEETAETD